MQRGMANRPILAIALDDAAVNRRDPTLLPTRTAATITKAIEEERCSGVLLCTGRSLEEAVALALQLQLQHRKRRGRPICYIAACNGALLVRLDSPVDAQSKPAFQVLRRRPLPSAALLWLLGLPAPLLRGLVVYEEAEVVPYQASLLDLLKSGGARCRVVPSFRKHYRAHPDGVFQVVLPRYGNARDREKEEYTMARDKGMTSELRAVLEPLGARVLVNTDEYEIVAADASTAVAAADVCGQLPGRSLQDVLALGCDDRDVDLLQHAGHSVALRGASKEAREAARRVSRWTTAQEGVGREVADVVLSGAVQRLRGSVSVVGEEGGASVA